jgi:hypothetical protein
MSESFVNFYSNSRRLIQEGIIFVPTDVITPIYWAPQLFRKHLVALSNVPVNFYV